MHYVRSYCIHALCEVILYPCIMWGHTVSMHYVRSYCIHALCEVILYPCIMWGHTVSMHYVRSYCIHALCEVILYPCIMWGHTVSMHYVRSYCIHALCEVILYPCIMSYCIATISMWMPSNQSNLHLDSYRFILASNSQIPNELIVFSYSTVMGFTNRASGLPGHICIYWSSGKIYINKLSCLLLKAHWRAARVCKKSWLT